MNRTLRPRTFVVAGLLAAIVNACAGSSPSVGPTQGSAASPLAPASSGTATSATPSSVPSLPSGSIRYRVVNLTDLALHVYVRTQGLVKAAAATSVAPGAVSAVFLPPEPGTVVVLRPEATNPTCLSSCSFLAESSTNFGEGDQRTIVVRTDGSSEYWEHPKPASVGQTGNAIAPADPARALVYVVAEGVSGAQFGLLMAFGGAAGCQKNTEASNILIGGNQVVRFALSAATADATLHASTDRDCKAAPVGGPFRISGAPGSRTFLFLSGAAGSMKGLLVPIP